MDYQVLLEKIQEKVLPLQEEGIQATYIPELAQVNPKKYGVHIQFIDGTHASYGDSQEKFSIQSISKVLTLVLALTKRGDSLWQRVSVEPSGTAFNSLIQLELEKGIPRNPFINAGALVICDVLLEEYSNPKEVLLTFVRNLAGTNKIYYNEEVSASEKESGYRNIALANFLKSYGNLNNTVEAVLDLYFHCCSLELTCEELAKVFLYFANHGTTKETPIQLSKSQVKRINALMQTCGFYDEAGDFSFRVGLPGKSGVGGGIAAIHSGKYSVAVWSPRLNKKGNSVMGFKTLELLTTELESSIF